MSHSASLSGSNFAYAYGRIGVLQQKLINQGNIDRLVGAHNVMQLRQILAEIPFTAPVMPQDSISDVPFALEGWLKKELTDLVPDDKKPIFNILWLREDQSIIAHYLKEYFRYTSGLTSVEKRTVTAYGIEQLEALILRDDTSVIDDPELIEFIAVMKKDKTLTPSRIDHDVGEFIAARQIKYAKLSGSPLILRYVRHLIDLQNIRTLRRLPEGQSGEGLFLPDGEIDTRALTERPKDIAELIRSSTLPSKLVDSMRHGDDSTLMIERSLHQGLAHDIAEMRSMPLSMEAIFAYATMAQSQIFMVRSILIGKDVGLSAQDISRLLPPVYSTSVQNA